MIVSTSFYKIPKGNSMLYFLESNVNRNKALEGQGR